MKKRNPPDIQIEDQDYFKERQKMGFQGWTYSVQRIDLLIIAISGAGIYIALESLKYCLEHHIACTAPIKSSGLIFILSIIFNLSNQFAGKLANKHDMFYWGDRLKKDESEANNENTLADLYSNISNVLNWISVSFMVLGLIIFTTYFFITF